ncbi:MAG: hypothetical protein D6808_01195 [Candidatus Dadabacteria bacterium]|nr:MAG: hypothetical protein D6808_01195 [Candidatus Dadabacteria bacterium]
MRVHPSNIGGGGSKWKFSALAALLLFLLVVTIAKGPSQQVTATQNVPKQEKMVEVVVAKDHFQAGEPFEGTKVALERRPASSLPPDVVTSLDMVEGKVAAGPIPADYPLVKAFIAEPIPIVPSSKSKETALVDIDPVESLLREIRSDHVIVPIKFEEKPPPRGSRIAIAIKRGANQALVLSSAWIESVDGKTAMVLVPASKSMFFGNALLLGSPIYYAINQDGPSPYEEGEITTIEGVRRALEIDKEEARLQKWKAESKDETEKVFVGYASVKDSKIKYGIDTEGRIFEVDSFGKPVSGPLSSVLSR